MTPPRRARPTPPPAPAPRPPAPCPAWTALLDAIDELDRREAAAASGGSPPRRASRAPQSAAPASSSPPPNTAATIARAGSWTEADKASLLHLAAETAPRGAAGWAAVATKLGRGPAAAASAERLFRTLADPAYARATSAHGRRLGPRSGPPMAALAAAALATLPGRTGTLAQVAAAIQALPACAPLLDWSPRPGTKTYPRWKDALVGCFKAGRYPHLAKTGRKDGALNVYALVPPLPPAAEAAIARVLGGGGSESPTTRPAATAESPAAAARGVPAPRSPPSPESHASAPEAAHAPPPTGVMTVTAHVTAARPLPPAA